jgi:hypothetical protein
MKLVKIAIAMVFAGECALSTESIQKKSSKNGVYLDYEKNLMWQDDINAKEVRKNWDSAMEYCENLTLAGYSDWYLPNKENLEILYRQHNALTNKLSSGYWSSTPVLGKSDASWIIFFSSGNEAWRSKKIPLNVRCVRTR